MKKNIITQLCQDQSVIGFNQEFLKEVLQIRINKQNNGQVFPTKNPIWDYIPTTTLRLYWLNKKSSIHRLVEGNWQIYLLGKLNYPYTSFLDYLLTQKSETKFHPDTVKDEIRIWFDLKNKILQ